jgi:hypothetical protein
MKILLVSFFFLANTTFAQSDSTKDGVTGSTKWPKHLSGLYKSFKAVPFLNPHFNFDLPLHAKPEHYEKIGGIRKSSFRKDRFTLVYETKRISLEYGCKDYDVYSISLTLDDKNKILYAYSLAQYACPRD